MDEFGTDSDYLELPPAPPAAVPKVLAGRYRLAERIGSGAFGVVHRAIDRIDEREVAVKLLSKWAPPVRLRREVVALRGLRIDGVVQLIDEGVADNGQPFIVTEFIHGEPFPVSPTPWPVLKPLLCQLLLALEHVHRLEVLHLDLKPQNVLVTPAGKVVLLDFGLAGGAGLGDRSLLSLRAGTRRYQAPELWAGEPPSRFSDLYAVGLMAYQAAFGRLPSCGEDAMRPLRHFEPVRAPDVACQALLSALLAHDVARRPASAGEALDILDPDFARWSPGEVPASPGVWCQWFVGPERICHLPSRVGAYLKLRTGGEGARVEEEVNRWIRAGLVVLCGGRLRVQESLFVRLTATRGFCGVGLTGARGRIAESASASDGTAAALEVIRYLHVRGQLEEAFQRTMTHLALIRRGVAEPAHEEELLTVLTRIAYDQRTLTAIELALYELGRCACRSQYTDALEMLLQSTRDCERGDDRRCLDTVEYLLPFEDPTLERRRLGTWIRCVARFEPDSEDASVRQACKWALRARPQTFEEERLDVHAYAWLAGLAYRQGDFSRAVTLHRKGAERSRTVTTQLARKLDAASALLEVGRYDEVHRLACEVLVLASKVHLVLYEGRSEWLQRAVCYRTDCATTIDWELVMASQHVGIPYLAGLIHVTEAAVAWRLGVPMFAHELALYAVKCFRAAGWYPGRVLAESLVLVTHTAATVTEVEQLARTVRDKPVPDVDWQVLALCHHLFPDRVPASWVVEAMGLACDPQRRRELLAPAEALAIT